MRRRKSATTASDRGYCRTLPAELEARQSPSRAARIADNHGRVLLDQLLLSPALAEACERSKTLLPPDGPLASLSPVQDAGFLLLELGLGQDPRREQLAELLQLRQPIAHVL